MWIKVKMKINDKQLNSSPNGIMLIVLNFLIINTSAKCNCNKITASIDGNKYNYFEGQNLILKCGNLNSKISGTDNQPLQTLNSINEDDIYGREDGILPNLRNLQNTNLRPQPPPVHRSLTIFKESITGDFREDIVQNGKLLPKWLHSSSDYKLESFQNEVELSINKLRSSNSGSFKLTCSLDPCHSCRSSSQKITVRAVPKKWIYHGNKNFEITDDRNYFKINFNKEASDIDNKIICKAGVSPFMDISLYLDGNFYDTVTRDSSKMKLDHFSYMQETTFQVNLHKLKFAKSVTCRYTWSGLESMDMNTVNNFQNQVTSKIIIMTKPDPPKITNTDKLNEKIAFLNEKITFSCQANLSETYQEKMNIAEELSLNQYSFQIADSQGQQHECGPNKNGPTNICHFQPRADEKDGNGGFKNNQHLYVKCKVSNKLGYSNWSEEILLDNKIRPKILPTDRISSKNLSSQKFIYPSSSKNSIICNFQNPKTIFFEKFNREFEIWDEIQGSVDPKYQVKEPGEFRCREFYDKAGEYSRKVTFSTDYISQGQMQTNPENIKNSTSPSFTKLSGLFSANSKKFKSSKHKLNKITSNLQQYKLFLSCGYDLGKFTDDSKPKFINFHFEEVEDYCQGYYKVNLDSLTVVRVLPVSSWSVSYCDVSPPANTDISVYTLNSNYMIALIFKNTAINGPKLLQLDYSCSIGNSKSTFPITLNDYFASNKLDYNGQPLKSSSPSEDTYNKGGKNDEVLNDKESLNSLVNFGDFFKSIKWLVISVIAVLAFVLALAFVLKCCHSRRLPEEEKSKYNNNNDSLPNCQSSISAPTNVLHDHDKKGKLDSPYADAKPLLTYKTSGTCAEINVKNFIQKRTSTPQSFEELQSIYSPEIIENYQQIPNSSCIFDGRGDDVMTQVRHQQAQCREQQVQQSQNAGNGSLLYAAGAPIQANYAHSHRSVSVADILKEQQTNNNSRQVTSRMTEIASSHLHSDSFIHHEPTGEAYIVTPIQNLNSMVRPKRHSTNSQSVSIISGSMIGAGDGYMNNNRYGTARELQTLPQQFQTQHGHSFVQPHNQIAMTRNQSHSNPSSIRSFSASNTPTFNNRHNNLQSYRPSGKTDTIPENIGSNSSLSTSDECINLIDIDNAQLKEGQKSLLTVKDGF